MLPPVAAEAAFLCTSTSQSQSNCIRASLEPHPRFKWIGADRKPEEYKAGNQEDRATEFGGFRAKPRQIVLVLVVALVLELESSVDFPQSGHECIYRARLSQGNIAKLVDGRLQANGIDAILAITAA